MQLSTYMRWLETFIITIAVLAICYFAHPVDPFFLRGTFSWVLFAPILVSLRYGSWFGLVSVIITFIAFFYLEPKVIYETISYKYYIQN